MFVGYYKLFINNKVETDPMTGYPLTFPNKEEVETVIRGKVNIGQISLKEDVVEILYYERFVI